MIRTLPLLAGAFLAFGCGAGAGDDSDVMTPAAPRADGKPKGTARPDLVGTWKSATSDLILRADGTAQSVGRGKSPNGTAVETRTDGEWAATQTTLGLRQRPTSGAAYLSEYDMVLKGSTLTLTRSRVATRYTRASK